MVTRSSNASVRAGVFHNVDQADEVVHELKAHGFDDQQITVVCSDRTTEEHFRPYEHQEPAGFYLRYAIPIGAATGAALLGVVACTVAILTGIAAYIPQMLVLALLTGAIVGGFLGEMSTRAAEKELADFYDQGVVRGEILVAVEEHGEQAEPHLKDAENIIQSAGARPLKLPEG